MCIFLGQKKHCVWETLPRNFKFYAKTLTKLHDLTVVCNEFTSGSPAPEPGGRTAPGPQVVPHRHIPAAAQEFFTCGMHIRT